MSSAQNGRAPGSSASSRNYKDFIGGGVENPGIFNVAMRAILFVSAFAALIVVVTSKQSTMIPVSPTMSVPGEAKFSHSPSYTYFVAAIAVTCLYSVITGYLSFSSVRKSGGSSLSLQFYFIILDSMLLGIMAAATGAAGGVAYMGLKGNSHTRWMKICHIFSSFCDHLVISICLAMVSNLAILLLVWLSVFELSKKIASR